MQGRTVETLQDRLLGRALEECMEEQLSFVPPEREIAHMHRFSPGFLMRMNQILEEQRQNAEKKIQKLEKREFVYHFNKIAACVLIFLVVGGLSFAGIVFFSPKGSSENAKTESALEDTAEAPAESMPMEEAKAEAVEEEERFVEVELVLDSSVISRGAEELKVTIGNLEKHSIRYDPDLELEVLIQGSWYTVPSSDSTENNQMVVLEAGMAQDEVILLSDYKLDYEAEQYRVVVYVDGKTICAPFRFGAEPFETDLQAEEVSEKSKRESKEEEE